MLGVLFILTNVLSLYAVYRVLTSFGSLKSFVSNVIVSVCLFFAIFYGDTFARSAYLQFLCLTDPYVAEHDGLGYGVPASVLLRHVKDGCSLECEAYLREGVASVYLYDVQSKRWVRYFLDDGSPQHSFYPEDIGYKDFQYVFNRTLRGYALNFKDIDAWADFSVQSHVGFEKKTRVILYETNYYFVDVAGWFVGFWDAIVTGSASSVKSCSAETLSSRYVAQ